MAPLKDKQKNPGDELRIHDPQSIFWLVWAWTLHLRTLTSSLFVSAGTSGGYQKGKGLGAMSRYDLPQLLLEVLIKRNQIRFTYLFCWRFFL